MGWNRFCKSPIKDVEETLLLDIAKEKDTSILSFYVGCDSMLRRQEEICYTTVLVMLRQGAGGIGYYQKIKERDPHSTRKQRLFRETYEAVQAALFFNPKGELQTKQIIERGTKFRFIPIGMILRELSILNYLYFFLLSSFSWYEYFIITN